MGAADSPVSRPDAVAELIAGACALGLVLETRAVSQFEGYLESLLLWRRRLSLISVADVHLIVREHVLDSLSVAALIKPGFRVADVGSGAGFPGIPLAIACPTSRVDLIESRRKKANFLREVVRNVRLSNVEVIESRAEAVGAALLGVYDVVVSRALWHIHKFLQISRTLLKQGGLAIAMKGRKSVEESAGQHEGFSSPERLAYVLESGKRRSLLVYRKQ